MKKETMKRLLSLAVCLILIAMAVVPAAATTPEEDMAENRISVGMFWVGYSLICFVLPLVLAGVGIKLALSETRGRPKYWIWMTGACGVWLILSALLAVVLLVI